MADQNNLNKPDLESSYSTEVLQTIRGHIMRLWRQDYSGMAGLAGGMRRWEGAPGGHVKLYERAANGAESLVFDSSALSVSSIASVPGLQAALDVKATSVHTHDQANVTGLVDALNGKVSAATFNSTVANINAAIADLGSNGNGDRVVSSAEPSGGSDGDIWLQV